MEEMDGRGVAAVLAADADLQAGPGPASALDAGAHEVAHALGVD